MLTLTKPARPNKNAVLRTQQMNVNGLAIDVLRKNIKTLRLTVYPPDGRVQLSVPARVSEAIIRTMLTQRWGWIEQQRAKIAARPAAQQHTYISGEVHYFQGQGHQLNVIIRNTAPHVEIRPDLHIDLFVREGSSPEQRQALLNAAYRQHIKTHIPQLIARWQPIMGVTVAEWGVKQMRTKWGTCNTRDRRIWLNLELMKKPPECLEYVVVHEMVHLLERNHTPRFFALMDKFMPRWREHKTALNRLPMGT